MKYNKTKVASVVHIRYWPMGPGEENARGLTNNAKRNYLAVLHSSLHRRLKQYRERATHKKYGSSDIP